MSIIYQKCRIHSGEDTVELQDTRISIVHNAKPHLALEIPDIILCILDKLVEDINSQHADLLSMALSCKAFEGPSLDLRWKTMSSIMPLLKLIPGISKAFGALVPFSAYSAFLTYLTILD